MRKRDSLSIEEIEAMEKTTLDELLEKEKPRKPRLPRKGVKMVASVRLDPETLNKLDEYAESLSEKTTVIARELIREGLEAGGLQLSPRLLMEMAFERQRIEEATKTENSLDDHITVLFSEGDIVECVEKDDQEGSTSYLIAKAG
jgi:predicted transcriptional regulator